MSVHAKVLAETVQALSQAAARLRATQGDLAGHFPLTSGRLNALSQIDQERLDALAVRYARCQDLLAPAMRARMRGKPLPHCSIRPRSKSTLAIDSFLERGVPPASTDSRRLWLGKAPGLVTTTRSSKTSTKMRLPRMA